MKKAGLKNHTDRKHSTVGASQSERWLNCPGSVRLSALAPVQPESAAAKRGTEYHEHLEKYLKELQFKGQVKVTDEHGEVLSPVVEYIADAITERGIDVDEDFYIESKVVLDFIDPDCFGTIDVALAEPFGTLEIIDLKTGFKPVDPVKNTQLIYYALGIAHKYDFNFHTVKLTVAQPTNKEKPISSWEAPIAEIEDYVEYFSKGVKRTKDPNAKLFAGKWCHFCPAAATCPELMKKTLGKVQEDFEVVDSKAIAVNEKALTPQKVAQYLESADQIELWVDAIRKVAKTMLEQKQVIPGWALLPTRPTRKWKDEAKAYEVAKKLKVKFYKQEALGPSQLEKTLGKDHFEKVFGKLVKKESGGSLRLGRVRDVGNDFDDEQTTEKEW